MTDLFDIDYAQSHVRLQWKVHVLLHWRACARCIIYRTNKVLFISASDEAVRHVSLINQAQIRLDLLYQM